MPKIQALQSLRALAALLVVFDHATLATAGHGLSTHLPFLGLFLGAQGVAIFFVISGFIITYTADVPDGSRSRVSRAVSFLKRRIVRVVPLYWLLTSIVALIVSLAHPSGPREITASHLLKSLFFIPYVSAHGNMLPILLIGWTLNYEMTFYIIFAVTMLLPHHLRILALITILTAMVVTGAFFYPIFSGVEARSAGEFLTGPIILLFGLGAGLGWIRLKRPNLTFTVPGLLLVAPLLVINCVFAFVAHENPLRLHWNEFFWLVDFVIVALCIFGRTVRLPRLETLGDASYSLYLIHLLPGIVCYLLWQQLHFAAPVIFILIALATSAVTGLACYRWLERPLTRFFSRHTERSATS